jgi:phosphatidate cytidylyltransferase
MSSNLIKRVLFALWAVPLGWIAVNLDVSVIPASLFRFFSLPPVPVYTGQLVVMGITVLAMHEYASMMALKYPRNGFWLAQIWLISQFVCYFFPGLSPGLMTMYPLILLVAVEAFFWGKARSRWKRASLLLSATVFIAIAGISLLDFWAGPLAVIFPPVDLPLMLHFPGIIVILGAVFLCDTAAYFIGSRFGRHHISPTISPHKTLEGSVAGFLASVLVGTAGWLLFASPCFPSVLGLVMGVFIGMFATTGDLVVSTIKRYFGVKDASRIIPGHGGILDRFDSLFFTAPVLGLFLLLIERLLL